MEEFEPRSVTLEGEHVSLRPLTREHAADLARAGRDPETFAHLPVEAFAGSDDARAWIEAALAGAATKGDVPFAIVHRESGSAIGSTRFLDVQVPHRTLEIGYTWLGPDQRGTAVNPECKLLLMTHAFEELGAVRVWFKTDARNVRSQCALERLGARREGVLRKHMTLPDGFVRNSVVYAVVDDEWPARKRELLDRLGR